MEKKSVNTHGEMEKQHIAIKYETQFPPVANIIWDLAHLWIVK